MKKDPDNDRAAESHADDGAGLFESSVNPHPMLRYTFFRLAIFAIALGLLWLVSVRGLLLVALAVLISGLASYALLQRERDAVSVRVAGFAARRRAAAAARAAREDDIAADLADDTERATEASGNERVDTR